MENTTPFTNVDEEVFIDKIDGVEFTIEPGETRYFPTYASKHFAKHLVEKIVYNSYIKDRKVNRDAMREELRGKILGQEISTQTPEETHSEYGSIKSHEEAVKEIMVQEQLKLKKQKIEAMKIVEKDV